MTAPWRWLAVFVFPMAVWVSCDFVHSTALERELDEVEVDDANIGDGGVRSIIRRALAESPASLEFYLAQARRGIRGALQASQDPANALANATLDAPQQVLSLHPTIDAFVASSNSLDSVDIGVGSGRGGVPITQQFLAMSHAIGLKLLLAAARNDSQEATRAIRAAALIYALGSTSSGLAGGGQALQVAQQFLEDLTAVVRGRRMFGSAHEHIESFLVGLEENDPVPNALNAERHRFRRQVKALVDDDVQGQRGRFRIPSPLARLLSPWRDSQIRSAIKTVDEIALAGARPLPERLTALDDFKETSASSLFPVIDPSEQTDASLRLVRSGAATLAVARCLRALIEVEDRRPARNGGLSDVALSLEDPFTGEPLMFRVGPTRSVVYSAGPDGTDNGGDVAASSPIFGGLATRDIGVSIVLE